MIVSSTSTAPLLFLGSGGGGGGINEGGSSNCNFIFCLLKFGGRGGGVEIVISSLDSEPYILHNLT